MTSAERIVATLLEGEMDDFLRAAFDPMLGSWAKRDKFEEGRFIWSCPTHINKQKAEFRLVIDPDMPVSNDASRQAITMMHGLIDLSGQLTTYGHWFGFTYRDAQGQNHILAGMRKATVAMQPALRKPVAWNRHEALATAVHGRFNFMQRTVIEHVMTPEAKALGITYFTGTPKVEDEAPGADLWRD